MKIIAIYGSTRENGNSELLTEMVFKDIRISKVHLREKCILPIIDKRHDVEGFSLRGDDYEDIIKQVVEHDIIVFTTPLYWFGMSGIMKNFIDRWSQSLRSTTYDFKKIMKDKKAYVIITGGSDSVKFKALPLVQQFNHIFDFMSMNFIGYILGSGLKPGDVINDLHAVKEAALFNEFFKSMIG